MSTPYRLPHVLAAMDGLVFAPSIQRRPPPVSLNEIQNAKNLCPDSVGGCQILAINDSLVLKVGSYVRMVEAEAMMLVGRKGIPGPAGHQCLYD